MNMFGGFIDDENPTAEKWYAERGELAPDERRDAVQIVSSTHGGYLRAHTIQGSLLLSLAGAGFGLLQIFYACIGHLKNLDEAVQDIHCRRF